MTIDKNQTEFLDSISCTFYGDVQLSKANPIDYHTAIQAYRVKSAQLTLEDSTYSLFQQLPSLITPETSVPVRVWLFPLALLKSSVEQFFGELRNDLIQQVFLIIE